MDGLVQSPGAIAVCSTTCLIRDLELYLSVSVCCVVSAEHEVVCVWGDEASCKQSFASEKKSVVDVWPPVGDAIWCPPRSVYVPPTRWESSELVVEHTMNV